MHAKYSLLTLLPGERYPTSLAMPTCQHLQVRCRQPPRPSGQNVGNVVSINMAIRLAAALVVLGSRTVEKLATHISTIRGLRASNCANVSYIVIKHIIPGGKIFVPHQRYFHIPASVGTLSPINGSIGGMCPKCGTDFFGNPSCCAIGGTWFSNCGEPGNAKFDHTWREGIKVCKRKYQQVH